MKRIVLAVSGGVDSMVLFDFFVKKLSNKFEIIVAHFEHGIRDDSTGDLELVKNTAQRLGLKFEYERGFLGENTSEEAARDARYNFLRKVAKKYEGRIVTAHHQDDLVETVYINLKRGTGWRGLAVFGAKDIWRPFISLDKQQILEYAAKNKVIWNEDSTNSSDKYLRNRVRKNTIGLDPSKKAELYDLWLSQTELSCKIEEQVEHLIKNINDSGKYSRYYLSQIDELTAIEILRSIVHAETNIVLTRPQIANLWLSIKTLPAGKKHVLAGANVVEFTKTCFIFK